MAFAFEMQFTNLSARTIFQLGAYDFAQGGHDNGGIQQAPGNTLSPTAGTQYLSVFQKTGSSIAENWMDIQCTWVLTGANPVRFGVKLHFPAQVFSIGTDPYWYVMQDTNAVPGSADPPPDWIHSGKSPADPYAWPSTLPVQIIATPQATGDSLVVGVMITDWGKHNAQGPGAA
jgi:hypothetical protein